MKLNQVDELISAIDMSLYRLDMCILPTYGRWDLASKNGKSLKELQLSIIKTYLNEIKENLEWERTELEKLQ